MHVGKLWFVSYLRHLNTFFSSCGFSQNFSLFSSVAVCQLHRLPPSLWCSLIQTFRFTLMLENKVTWLNQANVCYFQQSFSLFESCVCAPGDCSPSIQLLFLAPLKETSGAVGAAHMVHSHPGAASVCRLALGRSWTWSWWLLELHSKQQPPADL